MGWNGSDGARTAYSLSVLGSNNEAGRHLLLLQHHVTVQTITLAEAFLLCCFAGDISLSQYTIISCRQAT